MKRRFPIMLFGGDAGAGAGTSDNAAGAGGGGAGTEGAGGVSDWRSGLTGEYAPLAKEKSLEQIKGKDLAEAGPLLAKGYVESQKMMGGMVALPKADPTTGKVKPEDQRAFWDKLGVPKDVEGYKDIRLNPVEGLGQFNEKLMAAAKPIFLKNGMSPGQAQEMLNLYSHVTATQRRELAESYTAEQAQLEEKWGLNWENNFNLAQRALNKYFSPGFRKMLKDSQLDMHVGMIEGLYEAGKNLAEARFIDGEEPSVEDNARVETEISTIRKELETINEGAPQRKVLQERMEALYKKRYGMGPVGPQK